MSIELINMHKPNVSKEPINDINKNNLSKETNVINTIFDWFLFKEEEIQDDWLIIDEFKNDEVVKN
jgi:hypothetical protein